MSQRIQIEIRNKVATCLTEKPIVCGNSDYEVEFLFDEEWYEHPIKTAMFVVNGVPTEQVFEGNVCKMPIVLDTLVLWVGVFAGTINDGTLDTTSPALVHCVPAIIGGKVVPPLPKYDVYNQIVDLCEDAVETAKSVEQRADNGEFNGEKGDKGDQGDKGEKGDNGEKGDKGDPYTLTAGDKKTITDAVINEIGVHTMGAIANATVDGQELELFGQKHFFVGEAVTTPPTIDGTINESYSLEIDGLENGFRCGLQNKLKGFKLYAAYDANYIYFAVHSGYENSQIAWNNNNAIWLDLGFEETTDKFLRFYIPYHNGNPTPEVHIGDFSVERKDNMIASCDTGGKSYFVESEGLYRPGLIFELKVSIKEICSYIGTFPTKFYCRLTPVIFNDNIGAYEKEWVLGFEGNTFVKTYHSASNDQFPHVFYLSSTENPMISFTTQIGGIRYASRVMTFADYIANENTTYSALQIDDEGYVYETSSREDKYLTYDGELVKGTDTIRNGAEYGSGKLSYTVTYYSPTDNIAFPRKVITVKHGESITIIDNSSGYNRQATWSSDGFICTGRWYDTDTRECYSEGQTITVTRDMTLYIDAERVDYKETEFSGGTYVSRTTAGVTVNYCNANGSAVLKSVGYTAQKDIGSHHGTPVTYTYVFAAKYLNAIAPNASATLKHWKDESGNIYEEGQLVEIKSSSTSIKLLGVFE